VISLEAGGQGSLRTSGTQSVDGGIQLAGLSSNTTAD